LTRALLALLALAGALLAPPAQAGERRYAVVVGVNQGAAHEAPLLFAERDAERFARVLTDLADVREEDLVLLRGRDADEVKRALAQVARRVADESREGEQQLLFVYYSGHGDSGGLHLRGSNLTLSELSEAVEAVPAQVRVMVVDACRSGELTRMKGGVAVEAFDIDVQDRLESEGMAVITSSSAGEDSQESDRLRGGVFTHHFVSGLQGAADASGDGRVTLTEAYRYSYEQTLATTSRAPVMQHPSYAFDLRGRDDLVITALDAAHRRGWIALKRGGFYLVFDKDGQVVLEADVPDGARLAVEPGQYLVRKREASQLWEASARVAEGEVVALTELAPIPYGVTVRKGYSESASAVVIGGGGGAPMLDNYDYGGLGRLGLRLDLEVLTLTPRLRYSRYGASNEDLNLVQQTAGAELSAVHYLDRGDWAAGIGLSAGADGVWQVFETDGEAAPRRALVGRTGPLLRLEYAPAARWLVGLEAGADVYLLQLEDTEAQLDTPVVPYVYLDLARYRRPRRVR